MTDVVRYENNGSVATITLNRPEAYNSLDYEAYEQLSARFREAATDPGVRAVVFTGTGRGFAANPPLAVQAAKHALRLARAGKGEELRSFIGTQGRALLATADHQESVSAFLERREPTFHGH